LRKASVGLSRALARLRPPRIRRPSSGGRRSPIRPGRLAGAIRPVQRTVTARFGVEAAIPAVVALIIGLASFVSWLPGGPARGAVAGAIGGPTEARSALLTRIERQAPEPLAAEPQATEPRATPRPAGEDEIAGDADGAPSTKPGTLDLTRIDPDAIAAARVMPSPAAPSVEGPFLADGTLMKPIAVTTTVADGKDLLRIHKIVDGDSIPAIAERYNISMMTVWWANDLSSHNLLVGKTLTIPPVDGLVVTVEEGDTLAGLASEHDVEAERVHEVNGLEDPVLVAGQTLILPGAAGDPIPEPTPPPTPPPAAVRAPTPVAAPGVTRVKPVPEAPATYAGGAMVWPVVGGNQFVSRGYAGGHQGLDVAADHGARVVAAAGGTVIFAGWKSNGGGYQVWMAHGSGVFTTYNHLSAISVGNGQSVGGGQQVGRIGASGNSTGPHLHFEVWHGPIWSGGSRVNPLAHL